MSLCAYAHFIATFCKSGLEQNVVLISVRAEYPLLYKLLYFCIEKGQYTGRCKNDALKLRKINIPCNEHFMFLEQ